MSLTEFQKLAKKTNNKKQPKRCTSASAHEFENQRNSGHFPARDLLKRLYEKRNPSENFLLFTDEHFQYRRAIHHDLRQLKFEHKTISSKACRNFQNILFSVNHADLMVRQQVGAFSRETISFSKKAGAMCQKYALYMIYKNYMAPQFTKKHVRRPKAHTHSPAQLLGLTDKVLAFPEIFYKQSSREDLRTFNNDWKAFWRGDVPAKYHRHHRFIRKNDLASKN